MLDITLGPHCCPFNVWEPDQGRVFEGLFAYDTETTLIDEDRPYLTPSLVLATACDGRHGVFISREHVPAFFAAHAEIGFVAHNAAFDLRVTQDTLGAAHDLYRWVERHQVWDTLILQRLYSLATRGHTARGECGLDDCARVHLGFELPKDLKDAEGRDVRTGFGRFLGRPLGEIPEEYLRYAAGDPLATWHLFWELNCRIKVVLQGAHEVWGYVDDAWLHDCIRRFGPLTHHVQLRAAIIMDVLRTNGIAVDTGCGTEKRARVQAVMDAAKERMRQRGYLVDQPGSAKAMQSILAQFRSEHLDVELRLTESGEKFSTAEEDLTALAAEDEFFADYATYRAAEKLVSTYLTKMSVPRLYPKFGFLLETGRTYCGGGFNLQNLPKEKGEKSATATIRGCFVPGDDRVFIDCDYGQIELVTFAYACAHQFGIPSELAQRINAGEDIHRLIAATVLGKDTGDVTKDERDGAKPVSFGRPGGMGAKCLRQIAKASYGKDLTIEEVKERIKAYHRLCPELDRYLTDEVDGAQVLAEALGLTPDRYHDAVGTYYDPSTPENLMPQGWVAGMLLKVLRDPVPATRGTPGRPYTAEEIAFFWEQAQRLPLRLKPKLRARLEGRRADRRLWEAVRNWAGRRPVFTVTGRLRANATFCSSRNCVFQGAAADGAILGLWLVWRAGHKLVDFVHDQLVVESVADDRVPERVAEIEDLMKRGMLMIVPGMTVKVETVVTRSLNKADVDPRYDPNRKEVAPESDVLSPATGAAESCPRPDHEGSLIKDERPHSATRRLQSEISTNTGVQMMTNSSSVLSKPVNEVEAPLDLCALQSSEVAFRAQHPAGMPTVIRRHEVRLAAPDHQFVIFSSENGFLTEVPTDEQAVDELLPGICDTTALIGTTSESTVSIRIEIRDQPPGADDLDDWDHVAEVDLHLPAGLLGVTNGSAFLSEPIAVAPCWHRARLYYGHLGALANDESSDPHHRLILWPITAATRQPVTILKRWSRLAAPPGAGAAVEQAPTPTTSAPVEQVTTPTAAKACAARAIALARKRQKDRSSRDATHAPVEQAPAPEVPETGAPVGLSKLIRPARRVLTGQPPVNLPKK